MAITMEELKRKAQRYDVAIERAKEIVNNQNASSVWKDWLRNTFPELKESKGEKIRKLLIRLFTSNANEKFDDVSTQEIIAWIEKQGEPIDKIEPKFHKGEWVVWQNKCYKVNYNGCGYELIDQNGISTSLEYGTVDKDAHLWTIADAKEGDVLYCKSDRGIEYIVMNKGINECGNIDSYFRYNSLDDFGFNIPSVLSVKDDNITPATKEQCDLLFKKLKEAGYEWDAEKKKPKKLGQQEVTKISDQEKDFIEIPFGAYDSEFIEDTYFIPEGCYAVIVGDEVVIKKGEKPTTWSEEDECYMSECIGAIATKNGWSFEEKRKTKLWLFSLKQRIGG